MPSAESLKEKIVSQIGDCLGKPEFGNLRYTEPSEFNGQIYIIFAYESLDASTGGPNFQYKDGIYTVVVRNELNENLNEKIVDESEAIDFFVEGLKKIPKARVASTVLKYKDLDNYETARSEMLEDLAKLRKEGHEFTKSHAADLFPEEIEIAEKMLRKYY